MWTIDTDLSISQRSKGKIQGSKEFIFTFMLRIGNIIVHTDQKGNTQRSKGNTQRSKEFIFTFMLTIGTDLSIS